MPPLRLRLVDGDAPARPAAPARPLEPELLALVRAMAAADEERDALAAADSTPAAPGVRVRA